MAAFLGVAFLIVGTASTAGAQRTGRRVVTLDVLAEHPGFYHGEDIIVRAEAVGENVLTYLVGGERRLLVLDVPPPAPGARETLEVIGTFYDVGRLEPSDPRAVGLPFERLSEALLDKAWPGIGELMVLVASSSQLAPDRQDVTLRTLALEPTEHIDRGVTVTGRFRGRNLYGDLPDSPGESRYDFVLLSANAAVWVVGREPKGDGFELDVQARIDTGRWLEVTGDVRVHEGMVIIEAGAIGLAEPAEEPRTQTRPVEVRQGPPPDVIFSTPVEGDIDVPGDTAIRVQFSRDMAPDSFDDKVRVEYSMPGTTTELPTIAFQAEYRALNRVLEIRLEQALVPFTAVDVRLLEGITASDGVALAPWSLSFYAGP